MAHASGSDLSLIKSLCKHPELDLIPTKIASVKLDPNLYLTPEKKSFPKIFKKKPALQSCNKNDINVCRDSNLVVTPEKAPSALKSLKKDNIDLPAAKNKVRFNIPISDSSSNSNSFYPSPSAQSQYNESSTLSTEFEDGSSLTTDDVSDFATKAAVFTQKNPLADITFNSHLNFESSSSYTTMSEGISSNKSFSKLLDMNGKKITQKNSIGSVVDPKKHNIATKIATAKYSLGHRKYTSTQIKIDKITSEKINKAGTSGSETSQVEKSQSFLKKKTGLQKHQHSIKYFDKEKSMPIINDFDVPKYNLSLLLGQRLQQMQEAKHDVLKSLMEKIENDSDLKSLIETRAANGTNIDHEDKLYSNLTCVNATAQDVLTAPEFRRLKRPHFVKATSSGDPNILDAFPNDLICDAMVLNGRFYSLPDVSFMHVPSYSVMSLYEHSLSWC